MRSIKLRGLLCVLGSSLLAIGTPFSTTTQTRYAFKSVPNSHFQTCRRTPTPISVATSSRETSLNAEPVGELQSLLISTIDSDISKMSDNEFAPVFLGGILVMLGGLLSAVFVGLIVDKKDLYSQIVADSYLQGADDEAFWKGLSEEEKKKTQEMLAKLKSSNKDDSTSPSTKASPIPAVRSEREDPSPPAPSEEKAIGMFSDYGDDA